MQVGYLERRQALITVDNRLVVIGYGAAKLREEMLQALIGLHPCLVLTGLPRLPGSLTLGAVPRWLLASLSGG